MVNQHLRQVAFSGATLAVLLSFSACGNEPLSDTQTGYLDMVPFYTGATTANPNAGLPLTIAPKRGWVNGKRVEYYDFGLVGHVKKRDTRGAELREPNYANVNPMYFFFDSSGNPLFAKPGYDQRSGVWTMKGGKDPRDPTPVGIDAPADSQERADYYGKVYHRRQRNIIQDDNRNSTVYQRPVIDVLGANSANAAYTGLWEVVEVKVVGGDYDLDGIKTKETIDRGIEEGSLKATRTGKVINCPVLDERTFVQPSALANNIPRPRIQVWYRTKLGECFLANGWETIGEVGDKSKLAHEGAGTGDYTNLRLFKADELDKRLNTFDVFSFTVGKEGEAATREILTAGVIKTFMPTNPTGSLVGIAVPKTDSNSPGGYSPIAWLWDTAIEPTQRIASDVNPAAAARGGSVVTNNIAIIGEATPCTKNEDCKWGMHCNKFPDEALATTVPVLGRNIVDLTIEREGGPRCDAPAVGYGVLCMPGASRCEVQSEAGSANETALKKILGTAAAPGPAFTVHADLAAAKKAYEDKANPATPPATPTPAEEIAKLKAKYDDVAAKAAAYDRLGYTKDFVGYGYQCFPMTGGFCHIRCDSGSSDSKHAKKEITHFEDNEVQKFKDTFEGELRCGGLNMLGYKCLSSHPERQKVCMRACNNRNTRIQNGKTCGYPLVEGAGLIFSENQIPRSEITTQECTSSATTCNWNLEFEPRDPAEWTGK